MATDGCWGETRNMKRETMGVRRDGNWPQTGLDLHRLFLSFGSWDMLSPWG